MCNDGCTSRKHCLGIPGNPIICCPPVFILAPDPLKSGRGPDMIVCIGVARHQAPLARARGPEGEKKEEEGKEKRKGER